MLFNASGTNIASAQSAADGSFSFAGLADGTYTVKFGTQSWWNMRSDWVPTTTGSLYYSRTVTVSGSAVADIGLRQIVRSTDVNSPLSTYTAPNGIAIRSYDDAVSNDSGAGFIAGSFQRQDHARQRTGRPRPMWPST